jgi:hypothetical protein
LYRSFGDSSNPTNHKDLGHLVCASVSVPRCSCTSNLALDSTDARNVPYFSNSGLVVETYDDYGCGTQHLVASYITTIFRTVVLHPDSCYD